MFRESFIFDQTNVIMGKRVRFTASSELLHADWFRKSEADAVIIMVASSIYDAANYRHIDYFTISNTCVII